MDGKQYIKINEDKTEFLLYLTLKVIVEISLQ